jgi:hypothetical protein
MGRKNQLPVILYAGDRDESAHCPSASRSIANPESAVISHDDAVAKLGIKTYMSSDRRNDMGYHVQLEPVNSMWKKSVHGFLLDGFGTGCKKELKTPVGIRKYKGEWGIPLMQIIGYTPEVGAAIRDVYIGVRDLIENPGVIRDGLDYYIPKRPYV